MKREKVISLERAKFHKIRSLIQGYFLGACSLSKTIGIEDVVTRPEDIDAIAEKILNILRKLDGIDSHAAYVIKYRDAIKLQFKNDPHSIWWAADIDY